VVIGAGPAGYPAAFRAADLGLDVTLIDPRPRAGGVCLYEGCIPSKTLLHVARVVRESEEAARWGVQFTRPKFDLEQLRAFSSRVIDKMTGGLGALTKQRRVRYIKGRAKFAGSQRLLISTGEKEDERIEFDDAILATGSRPRPLPGLSMDLEGVIDSTEALALPDVPRSLLVVGGGYIGLEIGTVYAALGAEVTLVEITDRLLAGVDTDLVRSVQKAAEKYFDAVLLRTRVTDVRAYKNGVSVTLRGPDNDTRSRKFRKVLVAVGRSPNTESLGLETTSVQLDGKGFVRVDAARRTADPHIYAIGDVAGEPMLAHKATHEGRIAAEAIAGRPAAYDPAAVPAVVFTDPEIAWAGLTESQAREQGLQVKTARFPWAASGRAATLDRMDGLTKLIIEPRTERVLGVGLVGVGAGELIGEGTLAVEMSANVSDLMMTIHPHPTLSETLMESAGVFFGTSPHFKS
jgi:dihydrolipoamide dehydrogenase